MIAAMQCNYDRIFPNNTEISIMWNYYDNITEYYKDPTKKATTL